MNKEKKSGNLKKLEKEDFKPGAGLKVEDWAAHQCQSAFSSYNETPEVVNVYQERFIWAHSSGDCSPWWVGAIVLNL